MVQELEKQKNIQSVIMLPLIKKPAKYNQNCSCIYEKYLTPIALNSTKKHKQEVLNESMCHLRKERNTNQSNNSTNKSMRKLKKYLTVQSKQNLKSYRLIKKEGACRQGANHQSRGQINLATRKVHTRDKPPHRYKTTMLIFKHCLLLYGGLGCEKNLTWARLPFDTMKWQMSRQQSGIKPINTYVPCAPIYGHTMVRYKDMAIIYGGSYNDQVNETTIINSRSMSISQGARCPFRRKEHAAVVLNDIMFVHGGIQSRQTKSQMFYYNISSDKWNGLSNSGLPALSGHKMAPGKTNREFYLFGGLTSRGKATNKLYKIKSIASEAIQVKCQLIECLSAPKSRYLFSFQKLSSNYLILYGGRQDGQACDQIQGINHGVFNDVYTFNMEKKLWSRSFFNTDFSYCFGMASTCAEGNIFIFGGSNYQKYADAAITMIWMSDQRSDPWQAIQANEAQIISSKRISNKLIL